MWGARRGKEEDTKGVLFCDGGFGVDFWEGFEERADREPRDDDFLFGNLFVNEDFFSVGFGHEEVMTRGARPCCIYFERIGNDCDDRDGGCSVEVPSNHVRIDGVGVDDDIGLVVGDELCDSFLRFRNKGEGLREILLIGRSVNPSPDSRGVGGDLTISADE